MKLPPFDPDAHGAALLEAAKLYLSDAPRLGSGRRKRYGAFIREFREHILKRARRVFEARGLSWDSKTVIEVAASFPATATSSGVPTLLQTAAFAATFAKSIQSSRSGSSAADKRVAEAIEAVRLIARLDAITTRSITRMPTRVSTAKANAKKTKTARERQDELQRAIAAGAVRPTPKEIVHWRGLDQTPAHQERARADLKKIRERGGRT